MFPGLHDEDLLSMTARKRHSQRGEYPWIRHVTQRIMTSPRRWVRTGDEVTINEKNELFILDRMKVSAFILQKLYMHLMEERALRKSSRSEASKVSKFI